MERRPLLSGTRSLDDVGRSINDLDILIEGIQNDLAALGTKLRSELSQKRGQAAAIAKEVQQALRQGSMGAEDPARKQRLVEQFRSCVGQLSQVLQQSEKREQQFPGDIEEGRRSAAPEERRFGSQVFVAQREDSVDRALIQETNSDVAKLEGELSALKDVVSDMAGLVGEGGQLLTEAEVNVTSSDAAVEKGVHELGDAYEYKQSARKKMVCIAFCCLVILAIVLVAIGLVLYLKVFK